MCDKINSVLFGKYLSHNLSQNIIGYDKPPQFGKLSDIDIKYILFSMLLFENLPITNFENIIEIGAGFGNMLRLNYTIQNFNKWIMIDYLHFNILQEYYLSNLNVDRNKYTLTTFNNNILKYKSDIVISIFTLSEYLINDFMYFYENIIKNTKYFFYVFYKNNHLIELNNNKIKIISQDFKLINTNIILDNLIVINLYSKN